MDRGTILVVDDEPNIAELIELYLSREGYHVVQAASGEAAVRAVAEHRPRLVVLDIGLPDIDGLEVCRRLRQTSTIPVIFLTARDGEVDRVVGLELGADDYVTKPFSPPELVARVKAVLRRADPATTSEIIQVADATIDLGRREVRVRGDGSRSPRISWSSWSLAEHPGLVESPAGSPIMATTDLATSAWSTHFADSQEARRCRPHRHRARHRLPARDLVSRSVRRGRSLGTRLVVAMLLVAIVVLSAFPTRPPPTCWCDASSRRTHSPTALAHDGAATASSRHSRRRQADSAGWGPGSDGCAPTCVRA